MARPAAGHERVADLLERYAAEREREQEMQRVAGELADLRRRLQEAESAPEARDRASAQLDQALRRHTDLPVRIRRWIDDERRPGAAEDELPARDDAVLAEIRRNHHPAVSDALQALIGAERRHKLPSERAAVGEQNEATTERLNALRRPGIINLPALRAEILAEWKGLPGADRRQLSPQQRAAATEIASQAGRSRVNSPVKGRLTVGR